MKILKIFQMSILTSFIVVTVGCNTTYKTAKLDPGTGYFPTDSVVLPNEVIVEEKIDINKYDSLMVFVKSDSKTDKLRDFVISSLKEMEIFEYVLDGRKAPSRDNCLVCRFLLFNTDVNFQCEVSIVNQEDNKTVFKIVKAVLNWSGLDQPLFYPIFNSIKKWALSD